MRASSPHGQMALSQLTRLAAATGQARCRTRSLPGFEIAGVADGGSSATGQIGTAVADVQICAYQVAMR